mmetsp:Transcript_33086/g.32470  ORF Transcript_33086/g.32470 Transcript_33086/m.32470 type:complete len:88 (-) Transcript_33086:77-340(-)
MGLRKLLIDTAKKHFKELEKLDANSVFTHSKNKSELLEDRFLDHARKNFMHESAATPGKPKPVPIFEFQNNTPPAPDQEPAPAPQPE